MKKWGKWENRIKPNKKRLNKEAKAHEKTYKIDGKKKPWKKYRQNINFK